MNSNQDDEQAARASPLNKHADQVAQQMVDSLNAAGQNKALDERERRLKGYRYLQRIRDTAFRVSRRKRQSSSQEK